MDGTSGKVQEGRWRARPLHTWLGTYAQIHPVAAYTQTQMHTHGQRAQPTPSPRNLFKDSARGSCSRRRLHSWHRDQKVARKWPAIYSLVKHVEAAEPAVNPSERKKRWQRQRQERGIHLKLLGSNSLPVSLWEVETPEVCNMKQNVNVGNSFPLNSSIAVKVQRCESPLCLTWRPPSSQCPSPTWSLVTWLPFLYLKSHRLIYQSDSICFSFKCYNSKNYLGSIKQFDWRSLKLLKLDALYWTWTQGLWAKDKFMVLVSPEDDNYSTREAACQETRSHLTHVIIFFLDRNHNPVNSAVELVHRCPHWCFFS